METNEKKSRFSVKAVLAIFIILAVAAALCVLFLHEKADNQAYLVKNSTVFDSFIYNGNTYTLSTATEDYSKQRTILRTADDNSDFLILPGENAKWCDEIGRFIYADGKKICSCNIDGSDRKTIAKLSGNISASLRDVIDGYAVVRPVTKLKQGATEGDGFYYLIDLVSGKLISTGPSAYTGISPVAISDGWFYYATGSLDGSYFDIQRCSIETGKCEVITDEIDEYIGDYGCVIDGYLYFHYEYGDVFRVPVGGGEVENLNLSFKDVGAKGAAGIISYEGNVLVACMCQNSDDDDVSLSLFSLEQDASGLNKILSFDVDSSSVLSSMRIQGNVFMANSRDSLVPLCGNL
jgi:hypothetical protein